MTQKTNHNRWTVDVRVRERNLKSGALTSAELEKYLADLPDLTHQAESFGTWQPALSHPPQPALRPSFSSNSGDATGDEDDDDTDDEIDAADDVADEADQATARDAGVNEADPDGEST